MKHLRLKCSVLVFCSLLSSCVLKEDSPITSYNNSVNLIQSGDIVVTNSGNDTIVLLDSDGTFKDVLVDSQSDAALIYNGLAWDSINKNILFTYDHTTAVYDAVKTISLLDGKISTLISNSNLSGTMPGVARLTGGDLVVLENTTTIEKFAANGSRVGNPFNGAMTANTVDITKLSNGGFVICSTATAATVRTYSAAAVLAATATSALPLPTLGALAASSCAQDPQGRIVVAYSGATDFIRVYDTAMANVIWTYSDTNNLINPGKISIRSNGNILVTDLSFNHIVEIDPNGVLVQVIGGIVLSTPNNIVVIP